MRRVRTLNGRLRNTIARVRTAEARVHARHDSFQRGRAPLRRRRSRRTPTRLVICEQSAAVATATHIRTMRAGPIEPAGAIV